MDDLISRQAAIDAIISRTIYKTKHEIMQKVNQSVAKENGWLGGIAECLDEIEDLPSAQPERKTGKWIDNHRTKFDGTFYWYRECTQCGFERQDCNSEMDSNYCPNCGAEMEG